MRLLAVIDMQEDFVRGVLYGINHVQSKFKGWYPTRAIETCCDICEGHTLATLCSYSVKTYKHNFSSICK